MTVDYTKSHVTAPPILDDTGKNIVAAIANLKNTDASFTAKGKPADANAVGLRFAFTDEKINKNFILIKNILTDSFQTITNINEFSTMNPQFCVLYQGHWYYYEDERWQDGGEYWNNEAKTLSEKFEDMDDNLTEIKNLLITIDADNEKIIVNTNI